VNPYDTEATAAAITHALQMSLEERKERWSVMAAALRERSIDEWCSNYLNRFAEMDVLPRVRAVPGEDDRFSS
jgi:trehalose 6-phosphate synthase